MMRIIISLIVLTLSFQAFAKIEEENSGVSMEKMLLVAKSEGLCEALATMVIFQKEKNIEGGMEFFNEFLIYTAQRKGVDPAGFKDACKNIHTDFTKTLESAREYDKKK